MQSLASPRKSSGVPRQPARRSTCPRGWPLRLAFPGPEPGIRPWELDARAGSFRGTSRSRRGLTHRLELGSLRGRASGETGAGLGVATGIAASEVGPGVGTASGTEAGEVALAAAGPRCRRGAAGAGPAAGRGGKLSAEGGKGSDCVTWLDLRFPDRGREGSSSVAAATAGTVVLADSVGAGAVAWRVRRSWSMEVVDPLCHAPAAPPRFRAEVTESNPDRWNAAPASASASVSVSGRGSWGQRRLEEEQQQEQELDRGRRKRVWNWNPPVFRD